MIVDNSEGVRVRLANATSRDVEIVRWDGHPLVVQEALDEDGSWRRIDSPYAQCGNSLGSARLDAGYECSFSGKRHDGPIQTRLRFRMDLGRDCMITSNEYVGSIPRWPTRPVEYWIGRLEDYPSRARSELLEIGEPAVPALREWLQNGSPRAQAAAAEILNAMEPAALRELEEVLNRSLPMGGWYVDGPFYDRLKSGLTKTEGPSHSFVRIDGRFDFRESRWNESERRIEALWKVAPYWPDVRLEAREEIRSELAVRAVLFTFSRDRRERNVRYVLLTASFALVCITEP